MSATSSLEYYPPREARHEIDAPIHQVTLQEDRAQVQRRALLTLGPGTHRLRLSEVAATLQDVSLRAHVPEGKARVSEISARRAMRVERAYQAPQWREVEQRIEGLHAELEDARHEQRRALARQVKLQLMLAQGAHEISLDTAWGMDTLPQWAEAIEALMARGHTLQEEILTAYFHQEDLRESLTREIARRQTMQTPNQRFVAWIDLDLVVEDDQPVTLLIEYVTPNVIWRPMHRASLGEDGQVRVQTLAALWQRTGEDWPQAQLVFSTTRSSLGVEPPKLRDDLLSAQRRAEQLQVQAREVEIQAAQVEGARGGGGASSPPPSGVELPGVDDGGEPQNLRPASPTSVSGDGRPHFVPLGQFEAQATLELLVYPELSASVFLRATLPNASTKPLLAGPVELTRQAGAVGWTTTLFVAPGEPFELSFGPQDELRVQRYVRVVSDKVDEVHKWRVKLTEVRHFISNLADEPRDLIVRERVPVSEIEHVKVALVGGDAALGDSPQADEHGVVTWRLTLPPYESAMTDLRWELRLAPDVANLPL